MRIDRKPLVIRTVSPLYKVQNEYFRKTTGVYKRILRAALERETGVLPIDLYIEVNRLRQADKLTEYTIQK